MNTADHTHVGLRQNQEITAVDELCGHPMGRRGGNHKQPGDPSRPCVREHGHKGSHRDAGYYERSRERDREYRQANADRLKVYFNEYYVANSARKDEQSRQWAANNRESANASSRRWKQRNPEKLQEYKSKRRARKNSVPHAPWTKEQVLELHGRVCWLCRYPLDCDWDAEHVIPISKGGPDMIENIRPAHPRCNYRKNAKMPPVIAQARVWYELGFNILEEA